MVGSWRRPGSPCARERLHEENELENLLALVPFDLGHGFVQGLVDRLGGVALELKLHELGIDVVDIVGKVVYLGGVGFLAVMIADQSDARVGGGFACQDLVGDCPDLLLGSLDQTPHGTGGIENETYLNGFFLGFLPFLFVAVFGDRNEDQAGSEQESELFMVGGWFVKGRSLSPASDDLATGGRGQR